MKNIKITGFWKRESDGTQYITYRIDDGEVRITNGVCDWIESKVKAFENYKLTYNERNFDMDKFMKYANHNPYRDITIFLNNILDIRKEELKKEIKTLEGWHRYCCDLEFQSGFNHYCHKGDKVNEEFVNYFMDLLPPACMRSDCSQVGEPANHKIDDEGKTRATHATFKKIADGIWEYCGCCFRGENVERGTELSYV